MNIKSKLTLICLSTLFNIGFSQNPEITSWMRNEDGDFADYRYYKGPPEQGDTAIQLSDSSDIKSVCYDNDNVYVKANGLASYTMGPFLMNPNQPSNQNYTFKFTRTPSEETGTKTGVSLLGAVGFAINGVVFYGYGDAKSYSSSSGQNVSNGDGNWDTDAWVAEGETMDATGAGHPDNLGAYHYHATPITLYNDPSTEHSPIIGYALDGYPIYGPFGYSSANDATSSVTRMLSGYELRNIDDRTILPDGSSSNPAGPSISSFDLGTYIQDYEFTGSGHLDKYNGRVCVTPEYPNSTYAYFLSTNTNGEPAFPYILAAEYYGKVSQSDVSSAGNATIPSGLTCYTGGTITSTGDQILASTIDIYPNPATDKVSIDTEDVMDRVIIIDSNGSTLDSYTPASKSTTLNTSIYSNGLYFVKIISGKKSGTFTLQVMN